MPINVHYAGVVPNAKIIFLQQHKSATPGMEAMWFFWGRTKHEMTDIYTIAIWTIKRKHFRKKSAS